MRDVDVSYNFPYNLLIFALHLAFPLLGSSSIQTQRVLTARETSTQAKKSIDEILLRSVTFFDSTFSPRRMDLLNECVIPLFSGLKKMIIHTFAYITNEGIQHLTSLEELCLSNNRLISDESVEKLTNIRTLDLRYADGIKGTCLRSLTKLKKLSLQTNRDVDGRSLLYLSGLEELNLNYNKMVHDRDLINILDNLRALKLDENYTISGECIARMTRLEKLSFYGRKVEDDILMQLTTLKELKLFDNSYNTDRGISTLTRLTSIDLQVNTRITTAGLAPFLHCLKSINLRDNEVIDRSILFQCPNLEVVYVDDEDDLSVVDDEDDLSVIETALKNKGVQFFWRKRDMKEALSRLKK